MSPSQIMITEDEGIVAIDIQEALKNSHYGVSAVASSGREALEKAAQSRPDLVLMDIRLKGDMDGVQTAAELKERYDVPIIYLTAYSDQDTVQRAKLTEPFAFLIKPFDKKELQTAIEMALYRHSSERERKRLEAELRAANLNLEKKVQERTEELRESESRFRSSAETSPDAVVLADAEGNTIFCNRSTQTLFGRAERDLLGQSVFQLMPERCHQIFKEAVRALAGKARPHETLELYGVDKSGREFPVEMSISTWVLGEKRFYAGILRDISERRQAEGSLRFQAGILSQVKDAVAVTDQKGSIVYWNRGAEQLYGLGTVEAIGREPATLLGGGSWIPPEAEKAVEEALSRKEVWHGETTHRKKDGGEVHVEMSVGPLQGEGDASVGRLMILRDISQRKKLEGMLIHSEKLAAMGQMAAGIAHELKTPLGMIYWFVEVLEKKDADEKERQEVLDTLKRQVERCSNLVNNILGFSRKGRRTEETDVDLNDVVASSLTLVAPHALAKKSIAVRREPADGRLMVRGVKDVLEQVVVNLALNAVDAMPEGGTLTLTTRSLRKGKAPYVQIKVADTGNGIPPEIQQRIFEPFFTTKDSGTGLGLWLVKQIVTGFRGEIECSSKNGKGTVFSVTFPESSASLS